MITYSIALILGTAYGFIFGLIPVAGAGTALITIYGFLDVFRADPYLLVMFTTAIVVSSSIGDSFASIMMNIPGAAGSAASMVDGFPMAKRGEGARALSAAITTSAANGLIWGTAVFLFLPFYANIVLKFAIPEMFAFLLMAMVCVVFVNSHYWFRGIIALMIGIFLGMVGQDMSGGARFTGGWYYLRDGIQIIPVLSGFLAMPELFEALHTKTEMVALSTQNIYSQIKQGIKDSWVNKIDGLRGGAIGALVGLMPGIGGNIVDWLSYGQTVAMNKDEKIPFGAGNVKGVIGCEGANNAQKASAYVPTVLFGVPAAPFEAIIMSLFIMVGIELGSPAALSDMKFFDVLFGSYMWSLLLTVFISFLMIRWVMLITHIPFKYYFWILFALILWSSVQYTGYWEDYAMFGLCCVGGLLCKYLKLSRAALIIGFVLSNRIESIFTQYVALYNWTDIFSRPVSLSIICIACVMLVYGLFFNRSKIHYV